MCIYIHIYIHVYVYVYLCLHNYVYMYTYIHMNDVQTANIAIKKNSTPFPSSGDSHTKFIYTQSANKLEANNILTMAKCNTHIYT